MDDGKEGTVVGTIDLGGAPEQGVSDGKGTVYINVADMANIAVVDAKNLMVTAHYDVSSEGSFISGLALDAKNHIFFLCPPAFFNSCDRRRDDRERYRENSPTDFVVEQTLPTMAGARTMVLDTKTNQIVTQTAEFGSFF